MEKVCLVILAVISLLLTFTGAVLAEEDALEYPYYLLDAYNPDDDCWRGMAADGHWAPPVRVVPQRWLVGPPPSELSAVTLPTDHWVELKFRGRLVDGPGDDILFIESGQCGEQALVFITDGAGQEYLLNIATALDTGRDELTYINFDISGISLPFAPCAVRILALDEEGGSPGFDLCSVRARAYIDCGDIACNPRPVDGARNVPADAVLSWSPGRQAEKHTVYFGTALADVDANAAPVSRPPQPQDANSFDPCGLELSQTYYWRIDQVNDPCVNDPCVWPGNIWSFTVADCIVVDDFESYNDSNKEVYDTWIGNDGVFVYISTDPAHGCELQSMAFEYFYADEFHFEVTRTFSPPQDWASADVEVLELFFHGMAGNDTDGQMYVALSDGDVNMVIPYDGDANDIEQDAWHVWRIELQDFNGLNLANVESISIGVRPRTGEPSSFGMGTVYFDDIRLYPPRCFQENRPAPDFTGDCAVDFEDLGEMVGTWLDRGYNIYPVAVPNEPLAWYRFDGNADDSAGSAHGIEIGNPTYEDGKFGQAISFDGYKDSVDIIGAAELFSKINTAITIAFWQYGEDSPHHTDTLCCSNYTYGVDGPAIAINLGCWHSPRRFASLAPAVTRVRAQKRSRGGKYNWDCGYPWSFDSRLSGDHRYKSEWSGRWNHWAFTKDARAGTDPNKGVMQIFLNGVLYDSRTDANSTISAITSFEIGSGWYGGYDGLIDDFRIYDYALSQPEIAHAATNGTGIFDLPLMLPADLLPDDKINFTDFAVLAANWLEEHLWP